MTDIPTEVTDDEDLEDLDVEDLDPYDIPLTNCDVHFLTKVSEVSSLGEAAEVVALNIVRFGLDSYNILYTNTDTGEQYISGGGSFVKVPVPDEELGFYAGTNE